MKTISKLSQSIVALTIAHASSVLATQAQPVPIPEDHSTTPQLSISGVGAATLNYSKNGSHGDGKPEAAINFSDSALLVGAAQRLGDGKGIGSTGLSWLTLDETNEGRATQLFLNQAFLDYQSETFEALVGRADNPTAHLVDFPTIRGDDLVTLTNPVNPFSDGENVEEHRYSNVASVTLNQGLKYFQNFHVQHLINSSGSGSDTGINAFGATFEYLGPPGMDAFQRVPSWGLGFQHFLLETGPSHGLHQIFAGGTLNLNKSVTNRWDLRVQDILTFGSQLNTFQNITDSFRGDSNAISAAIRYLSSPFGRLGYQLSLTGGYKTYTDISEAKTYGAALTGVKRLGQGFDMVAQYQGQWRDRALASVQTSGLKFEQTLELGFVFSFESTINPHLTPRRTLLNQQHQYVPN